MAWYRCDVVQEEQEGDDIVQTAVFENVEEDIPITVTVQEVIGE